MTSNTRFRVSMDSVHGSRLNDPNNIAAADTYWKTYHDKLNPLKPAAYHGDCQFPQITAGGLQDSLDHGRNLYAVYGNKLGFLPQKYNLSSVRFRVTSNVITSQVAGAVTRGMFPHAESIPLFNQYSSIDSLEPSYSCPLANDIRSKITNSELWKKHLEVSKDLAARLDAISGVDPNDAGWHNNWDHYFDSFSSKMCHGIPLPCSVDDPTKCVATEDVEQVLRWGQWEYSYLYRDVQETLDYGRLRMGVFLSELVGHLSKPDVKYRHNIGHDGSISLLLAALQVDEMVWPGLGAEVVVELWKKRGGREKGSVRVLWGGKVMTSSALGKMDMIPLETFTDYLTAVAGVGAGEAVKLCGYEK
ncbi:phosphoglycerate mutase-like protein [Wilcoxina mikolae CBS 423.85]|nr:phosphoglycerate mutase-like protein [Wilcoxina mikolae CBS 423.85]